MRGRGESCFLNRSIEPRSHQRSAEVEANCHCDERVVVRERLRGQVAPDVFDAVRAGFVERKAEGIFAFSRKTECVASDERGFAL